jgi:hypothetical protein
MDALKNYFKFFNWQEIANYAKEHPAVVLILIFFIVWATWVGILKK